MTNSSTCRAIIKMVKDILKARSTVTYLVEETYRLKHELEQTRERRNDALALNEELRGKLYAAKDGTGKHNYKLSSQVSITMLETLKLWAERNKEEIYDIDTGPCQILSATDMKEKIEEIIGDLRIVADGEDAAK